MQILITERTDITPLLGMDWMIKFRMTIKQNQTVGKKQTEKEGIVKKFNDLFENNTTMKDAEINIQFKPVHYAVKQKARPTQLHLQENLGKQIKRPIKSGHLERVQNVEGCFVSPVVITIRNDKSEKIALDSRKLNESCRIMRPHMPYMDESLKQTSMETTRDRTKNY